MAVTEFKRMLLVRTKPLENIRKLSCALHEVVSPCGFHSVPPFVMHWPFYSPTAQAHLFFKRNLLLLRKCPLKIYLIGLISATTALIVMAFQMLEGSC